MQIRYTDHSLFLCIQWVTTLARGRGCGRPRMLWVAATARQLISLCSVVNHYLQALLKLVKPLLNTTFGYGWLFRIDFDYRWC